MLCVKHCQKSKSRCILLIAQRPDTNKNDKTRFFEKFAKMVILENNKNENFKFQNFNGKCFFFDPLPRDRRETRFSKSCQISAIGLAKDKWKSPLG